MNQEAGAAEGGDARTVEVHARTVDEAVARGLVRLGGLSRSEVEIEVVSEGRTGLLGFGSEEAVVRLRVLGPGVSSPPVRAEPAPATEAPPRRQAAGRRERRGESRPTAATAAAAPGDGLAEGSGGVAPAEAITLAGEITMRYLSLLGYEDASIEPGPGLVPMDVEEEMSLVLNVRGAEASRLLARDGRPLLALQFLVRLAVNRQTGTWVNLLLDVDGDRARRVKELFALAEQSAELVDRDGRPVSLPPMTPYERRVVHIALKDHTSVTTQSIGRGDTRKVTVRLKGHELPDV